MNLASRKRRIAAVFWLCLWLAACAPAAQPAASQTPPAQATPTGSLPSPTVPAASPTREASTATVPAPPTLWLSPDLPAALVSTLNLPPEIQRAESAETADLRVEVGGERPLSAWIYALAAPFPTYTDEVTTADLRALWTSGQPIEDEGMQLLGDASTIAVFSALWGPPSAAVKVVPAARLVYEAWDAGDSWAILPFENLDARWKVLAVDGQSPVRKDFDPTAYPLEARFSLNGETALANEVLAAYGPRSAAPLLAAANRDAHKLTTVLLTGVTALVRGTAVMMELKGMDYPAQDIGDILRQADILHINNEVPFAKNCPDPYPWEGLVFCSRERYIQLLESIGTDVVELAGDHFADWGPEAMHFTLDLYQERGWPVYGGGETIDAAKQPAYFEHNGNKIAFIGCNYKAVGYATASATNPGAVHCDPDWLYPAIRAAKEQGYLPIVTFQDDEYYEYIARPKLQTDFRGAAAAGAVIVSGSQAHQPHALDVSADAMLTFGLGNLFFDQVGTDEATRWAFLARHVFYDGKYISTELISITFVDLARARLSTPDERRRLLEKVFHASGWK